jgi:hypothetical protein
MRKKQVKRKTFPHFLKEGGVKAVRKIREEKFLA